MQPITIRYRTITRSDKIVIREKSFPNDAAMERWIEKQEEKGTFLGIESFEV